MNYNKFELYHKIMINFFVSLKNIDKTYKLLQWLTILLHWTLNKKSCYTKFIQAIVWKFCFVKLASILLKYKIVFTNMET